MIASKISLRYSRSFQRILLFSCLGLLTYCEQDQEKYVRENKSDILTAYADVPSVPADSNSVITITADLTGKADVRDVTFLTSAGKFRYSDTDTFQQEAAYSNGKIQAKAYLIPSLTEQSNIEVKVSVAKIDTVIKLNFTRAYPDSLHIESPTASIKRGFGSEATLFAHLFRSAGYPSNKQQVSFRAERTDKTTIGEFRGISPFGSYGKGSLNAVFVLKDSLYTGPVKIIGQAKTASSVVRDTVIIHVTN